MVSRILAVSTIFLVGNAVFSQTVPSRDTPQIQKAWELGGQGGIQQLKKDGIVADASIDRYLRKIADSLTPFAGSQALQVRLTRSSHDYSLALSNQDLYISAGLFTRFSDESELAGFIAHQVAHFNLRKRLATPGGCIIDLKDTPLRPEDLRDEERQATVLAVTYLTSSGYDPAGALSLLSKLAYDHRDWAKAIDPEDLLNIRSEVETGTTPAKSYKVDSSDFVHVHEIVQKMLNTSPQSSGMARTRR